MPLTLTSRPKALLALDTEVAAGWWWYDGKTTHRLGMFCGQFLNRDKPFGWIILPEIILGSDAVGKYEGLPVVDRETALLNIVDTVSYADALVGHNLTGFDIGTINGELKLKNLPLLPSRPVLDTLNSAKKVMGQSMSLANRLSRLDGTVKKPKVEPVVWEAAFNDYDPDALHEVWARASTDVQGHIDLFLNDSERGYMS